MMNKIARSLDLDQRPAHAAAQRTAAAFVRLPNPRSFDWRGVYFAYFYGAYQRQIDGAHASG
ncbi:MAG: hypothetical protein WBF31_09100 [Anaerolineae bacterium]